MSSIITSLLNLTFGLLWEKLRDHTAERLQYGDVTDEKCREIIVRELDNLRSLLVGLSRKDLLSSISFLKEGVRMLNIVFSGATDDGQSSMQMVSTCRGGSRLKQNQLNEHECFEKTIEQLSRIITNLDSVSKERLSSARIAFADARREATRAFNNQTLSTKDRILACKLRVISRILEHMEDPEVAVETCMLYLEELHNLQTIQEIFSVHIAGGLKARFNKRKRQELMSSVIMINYVLANFTLHFAKRHYNLLNWPKVEINSCSFHPILDHVANAIMHNAKVGAPNRFAFDRMNFPEVQQQDRKIVREILATGSGNIAEITIRDGEIHFCLFNSLDEIVADSPKILLVVTNDGEDNIYVVAYVETSADEFDFSLIIADSSGKNTRESNLEFLSQAEKMYRESAPIDEIEFLSNRPSNVQFTVNSTIKTSIFSHQTCIYVCKSNGVLLHYFETTNRNDLVGISNNDGDVITARYYSNTVYVYSVNGSMINQFNVARGQVICDVVSHHTTQIIYALTCNNKQEFQLETYTHHGEHRESQGLIGFNFIALFILREGPVAAIYDKGFILI